MNLTISGSSGALGVHTVLRAMELGLEWTPLDLRSDSKKGMTVSPHVIHLAGITHGTEEDLTDGNLALAKKLAGILEAQKKTPEVVTYANTIRSTSDETAYSRGKRSAGNFLAEWCRQREVVFRNVLVPNLIGPLTDPYRNMVGASIVFEAFKELRNLKLTDTQFGLGSIQDAADVICEQKSVGLDIPVRMCSPVELRSIAERVNKQMKSGLLPGLRDSLHGSIYEMLAHHWSSSLNPVKFSGIRALDSSQREDTAKPTFGKWGVSEKVVSAGGITGSHFRRRSVFTYQLTSGYLESSVRPAWLNKEESKVRRLLPGDTMVVPVGFCHHFVNTSEAESAFTIFHNGPIDLPESIATQC